MYVSSYLDLQVYVIQLLVAKQPSSPRKVGLKSRELGSFHAQPRRYVHLGDISIACM